MGTLNEVLCNSCSNEFRARVGGGFGFELLRCNKCGKESSIGRKVLRSSVDLYIVPSENLTRKIQEAAGQCECGGEYCLDAPIRCPICKSRDVKVGHAMEWYD